MDVPSSDMVILAGVAAPGSAVSSALTGQGPAGAESLAIRTGVRYQGKRALVLSGGDGTGVMYAALDTAQRVQWAGPREDPFRYVKDVDERPFLRDRGVVMFTMNRAYFESRLHDPRYWQKYFDMLAEDRINTVVLTFGYEDGGYMAPFYPYFFDVPGYPDVKVVGLTPQQQKRNFDSLRTMVRLAGERGIRIKPGIWDHIYRGGGQAGKIAWASDGSRPTPGLVWGVTTENVTAYTIAALDRFYTLFPEIKQTQFRVHNESGLRDSEIGPFWHDVFHYFATRRKDVELELRAKGLDKAFVRDALAQGVSMHLDTKIWMEQMGLPYHPTHINIEDQNNTRHSYSDLLEYPKTYWVNWTLWNGGSQRLLEWFDPEYARRLVYSARLYDGPSLVVTEMEATKMLSEPPQDPAHDFFNPKYKYFDYEFQRYWAFYRVFGRMAYDPETAPDIWEMDYLRRFGPEAGPHVMRALELASGVLPHIVAASVPYSIFPTTSGWPEMMHLGSLPSYAAHEEGSDLAQFENVREEATRLLEGGDTAKRRPEDISHWFSVRSGEILQEVELAERNAPPATSRREFDATLTDARILAALARYHAARQMGAVNYNLYRDAGSLPAFDAAIAYEGQAVQAWKDLIAAAGDQYIPTMYFGTSLRGFPHHWSEELPPLEKEYADLLAERKTALSTSRSTAVAPSFREVPLPVVTMSPIGAAPVKPSTDLQVRASVRSPEGVGWIHLRYRHVNQKEDFQSVPMVENTATGVYEATIPGAYITPEWDLMYYVEIVDTKGTGRIYPDLDRQTPYVVRSVQHPPPAIANR